MTISITIDHGPIPAVVEKAKVGERVQFDVTVRGRESEVTAIRPE